MKPRQFYGLLAGKRTEIIGRTLKPTKAMFNGLHQCWGCANCVGAKDSMRLYRGELLPRAIYPECKVMNMYMCEVYGVCEKRESAATHEPQ